MGQAADGWIALATQMIKANGQTLPFYLIKSRDGEEDYDPDQLTTPSPAGGTLASEIYGAPLDFKLRDIDKVTIMSGEKMLWMPGTDTSGTAVQPEVGDIVSFNGGAGPEYRVNEVTSFETESVNCAFLLKIGA